MSQQTKVCQWRITRDMWHEQCTTGEASCVGVTSTGFDHTIPTPVEFRLSDADGEVYVYGEMTEACSGFEPLDDFGSEMFGCTTVELKEGQKWVQL